MVRLPDFVIIGAQKCGSTTLHQDLRQHPEVFMPECKEVGGLRCEAVLTTRGMKSYSDYFRHATSIQLCGEAATAYSKIPKFQGIPKIAYELLGENLKIIYLVRDPIKRIISHHAHIFSSGKVSPDVNEAVKIYPNFINYSSYAMQLNAWLEYFPPKNIRIVHFESYVNNRAYVVEQLLAFLGLPPEKLIRNFDAVYNRAEDRRQLAGFLRKLSVTKTYKAFLQPMIPSNLRKPLRNMLTSPAPLPEARLSLETRDWLTCQLRNDQEMFAEILGLKTIEWWDGSWPLGPVCAPKRI